MKPALTQARLKELLHYEPETGTFTRSVNVGFRFKAGSLAGGLCPRGYIRISVDGKFMYAHRLAFLYLDGSIPSLDIDHIDGNKSNNSWGNLRAVSRSVNLQNRRLKNPLNKTSGLLGVSWHAPAKKWWAYIRVDGKTRSIGFFGSVDAAHSAYLDAKRSMHEGCAI